MNAADPRIQKLRRPLERVNLRGLGASKTAPAAALLLAGLSAIFVGLASFSLGAAEIVAGLLLVVAAVGYLRGSD